MLYLDASELEFVKGFIQHKVRFVVIGGHAVIHHGFLRPTKDLDCFVDSSEANVSRLISALTDLGISIDPEQISKLSDDYVQISVRRIGLNVDLITTVKEMDFGSVYERRANVHKDGVMVPVISLEDLLASKKISGRPQDLEDIEELEIIAIRTSANPDA
jgi:predicted nucleotidyltransferase